MFCGSLVTVTLNCARRFFKHYANGVYLMEPGSKQDLPGKYFSDQRAPTTANSSERPSDLLSERDLRKNPGFLEMHSEFGPMPDLSSGEHRAPVALWSVEEMVSDAEAAQATLKAAPGRRSVHVSYLHVALLLIVSGLLGFGIHRLHERQLSKLTASLRQQADRAREQGRQELYLRYLRQYIGYKAQDVDALAELASAMYSQTRTTSENQSLMILLERVCGLDPDRHDSRHRQSPSRTRRARGDRTAVGRRVRRS